jgi:replicative DNA helicase
MSIFNVKETIGEAVHTFHLDRDGLPELIPLGLPPFDDELGGLGPKACGILAAATGVGKSSVALAAMLASRVPVGMVSLEDGPDVVGCRLLAALTGINSIDIRKKNLTDKQLAVVAKVAKENKLDHMHFSYPIAGSIAQVERAITELCEAGCRMIWLDYLQEIRGHGNGDRRNEVSEAITRAHRAAAAGNAALMCISQFRRFGDSEKTPQIFHLKESGDLENKARVILLAHKEVSNPDDLGRRIRIRVGKSTYGGEHLKFDYLRDESGTLRYTSLFDELEDF